MPKLQRHMDVDASIWMYMLASTHNRDRIHVGLNRYAVGSEITSFIFEALSQQDPLK